ncbi:hypothetical protein AAG570_002039 [Ranatra chinensis]|uniref:Secreted protein n=1 Tax=Ranatra chinensis TaxID=642074 RepID=A0ABD0YB34_9HEMI
MWARLVLLVCVWCAAGGCVGAEDVSDAFDEAAEDLRWLLEPKRVVTIPAGTRGYLTCGRGTLGLLDTLVRKGPLTLAGPSTSANLTAVTLTGSFGFKSLYLQWDRCAVSTASKEFLAQPVNITVGDNSFTVQVTIVHRLSEGGDEEGCEVHVDKVAVDRLRAVKVTTSKGVWHLLEDRLIGWALRLLETTLGPSLVRTVVQRINTALGDRDVCSPFKPF